ncbi:hypothetical protein [Streptomyces sp. MBT62]|uniref:Rv1733c family protein n=1 Tax=Streptomyces sp. MBT62 TaxID=2800410 RepID=UPI0027DC8121|nr:hypothetical protein [Streptomyces sp. MBT62]
MVRQPRSNVRLWRWRRNPLRRRSDIVEAWILLAACILALVGGLLAGVATRGAVERNLDQQRVGRQAVSAVLIENARGKPSAGAADDHRVWATVRWTAPDGTTHTGQTKVGPDTPARTRVTVWTDRHGALTSKPASHQEAQLQAALLGVMTGVITLGLVAGGTCATRAFLDRRRMEQWAADWARTDTRWGGKTG